MDFYLIKRILEPPNRDPTLKPGNTISNRPIQKTVPLTWHHRYKRGLPAQATQSVNGRGTDARGTNYLFFFKLTLKK